MHTNWKRLGLGAVASVVFLVVLSGTAAAAGSGYNLSFSQSATVSNSAVALVALQSTDSGGANITISFTVAGTPVLNSYSYGYYVYTGGGPAGSGYSAFVAISNNSTKASLIGGGSSSSTFGLIPFTVSGGTITFSVAKSVAGPPSSFTLNAAAWYGSVSSGTVSWIGSSYGPGGGGGGGSCTGTSCTSTSGGGGVLGLGGLWWLYVLLLPIIVIIIVVVLVVVLLVRRKPRGGAPPPPGTTMPPGTASTQDQPYQQPQPPPPSTPGAP